MQLDTSSKLSPQTVILHWIVGITIIGLLATGVYMEENEVFALYPWHKSIGVIIFLFIALRIFWRVKNRWLTPVSDYSSIEKLLSKIVHYLLIIGTIVMPISGFIMSSVGGHGVEVFGLELIGRNPDPANPQKALAFNPAIAGFAHNMHVYAGYTIIACVLLHVVGAFKHHIIDKDGTLRRMLGAQL